MHNCSLWRQILDPPRHQIDAPKKNNNRKRKNARGGWAPANTLGAFGLRPPSLIDRDATDCTTFTERCNIRDIFVVVRNSLARAADILARS